MAARLAPTRDIKPEDERVGRESATKGGKFSDCRCFTNRRGKEKKIAAKSRDRNQRKRKTTAVTPGDRERATE